MSSIGTTTKSQTIEKILVLKLHPPFCKTQSLVAQWYHHVQGVTKTWGKKFCSSYLAKNGDWLN